MNYEQDTQTLSIWNFNVKIYTCYYQILYMLNNAAPRDNFPRRNFNPIHKNPLERVLERLRSGSNKGIPSSRYSGSLCGAERGMRPRIPHK